MEGYLLRYRQRLEDLSDSKEECWLIPGMVNKRRKELQRLEKAGKLPKLLPLPGGLQMTDIDGDVNPK